MTDLANTIDTYLDAYGEADAERRLTLIEQVFAVDGELIDPPLDGRGHAGISEMAAAVQGHYPGHTFRRVSGIDEHHGFARYAWQLVAGDGTVALGGIDVAQLDESGRITRVTGFLGDLPAREETP